MKSTRTRANVINYPSHYMAVKPTINNKQIESIDVIEAFDLGFHRGNAIKYILRGPKKHDEVQDLQKALWYIVRYLNIVHGQITVIDSLGNVTLKKNKTTK